MPKRQHHFSLESIFNSPSNDTWLMVMKFAVRPDCCNISAGEMMCVICVLFRLASDLTTLEGDTNTFRRRLNLRSSHFLTARREQSRKCVRRETEVFMASLQVELRQTDGASSSVRGKTRTSVATRPGKLLLAGVNKGRCNQKNEGHVWRKWDCWKGFVNHVEALGLVWPVRVTRFCV